MDTATESSTKTDQILDAISSGKKTITEIAEHTGIKRRSVNAFVYSLEKQNRVLADSYDVVRGEQQFSIISKKADPTKGRPRIHPYQRLQRALPAGCKNTRSTPISLTVEPTPNLLHHAFFCMVAMPTGMHSSALA